MSNLEEQAPEPDRPGVSRRRFLKLLGLALCAFALLVLTVVFWPMFGEGGGPSSMNNGSQRLCFRLAQDGIDRLRTATVTWDPLTEAGMVRLDVAPRRGLSDFVYNVLLSVSTKRQTDLESAFQIFLALAQLAPGSYRMERGDVVDFRPGLRDDLKLKPRAEFIFTQDHLNLLRNARGRWMTQEGTLAIDPKRPYGDGTAFEYDMAHILGLKVPKAQDGREQLSPEQTARLDGLFADLPFSLSVILRQGAMAPGVYCHTEDSGWRKNR